MPDENTKENTIPTTVVESEPILSVPEPVVASPTNIPTPTAIPAPQSSAGALILQWLTYAFWGWLILALVWLLAVVLANAILDETVSDMIPYAIAASVVLLPLAFVTDLFYRKHEPLKKAGGAVIIMVIHAVIFAILGIIALIITVFTALNMAIEGGDVGARIVSLCTAGFATILYASAFLRTLNPFKDKKPLFIYSIVMLGITVLLLIFAVVGPLAKSIATRNDRLIEQNLSSVENGINSYIQTNEKLPDSLNDVTISGDKATQLVKDNQVTYKKENSVTTLNSGSISTEHRYQLCVEYAQSDKNTYYSLSTNPINTNEYRDYVSTSSHGKGEECYKLKTTTYKYSSDL